MQTFNENAIRTIRGLNWKFTKVRAQKHVNKFLSLIQKRYPEGDKIFPTAYFVMPGYEHVTRNQPIAIYNENTAAWEISVINLFVNPKK